MYIKIMRSSSYNTHNMCDALYFYEYVLGIKGPPNFKTMLGSVLHRTMEMLANIKLCEQENKDSFIIDDIGELYLKDLKKDFSICSDLSFDSYKSNDSLFDWNTSPYKYKKTDGDLVGMHPREICRTWAHKAITSYGGYYNPLNHKVISPEIKFDFEIDEPWANYNYTFSDNTVHKGNLRIIGTSDLVVEITPKVYEIIDWKTGSMIDWKTKEAKTYESFLKEFQVLLYGYALRRSFPKKDFMFTMYYIRDGGPQTIPITKEAVQDAERLIKEKFELIKSQQYPPKVKQDACFQFCWFGKNKYPDSDLSYCNYLHREIEAKGADAVANEYGNLAKLERYGDGGGRKEDV